MDMEAQLLAMNKDAQQSAPVAVRGRQMTVEYQDESAPVFTPLYCGGPSSGYDLPGASELTQQAERGDAQWNHLMAGCCNLIPFVDTPLSSRAHERRFMVTPLNYLSGPCYRPNKVSVGTHTTPVLDNVPPPTPAIPYTAPTRPRSYAQFPIGQQMQVPGGHSQGYFADCMMCGKTFETADEIVIDFIHHTEYLGEPFYNKEARRRDFVVGMHAGTYVLIPRGVSQAATCDGNIYAIPQGAMVTNTTSANLPLLYAEETHKFKKHSFT